MVELEGVPFKQEWCIGMRWLPAANVCECVYIAMVGMWTGDVVVGGWGRERRGSRMEDRQSNLINKMWTFGTVDCTDGGQYEMFVRAIYFSE